MLCIVNMLLIIYYERKHAENDKRIFNYKIMMAIADGKKLALAKVSEINPKMVEMVPGTDLATITTPDSPGAEWKVVTAGYHKSDGDMV